MLYNLKQIDFSLSSSIILNSSLVNVLNIARQNPNLTKSVRVDN